VAALAFPQLDAKTFGAGPVHCDCLLYKMKIPLTTNVCPSTGEDTATSSPMHYEKDMFTLREIQICLQKSDH